MIEYKGYTSVVEFDPTLETFVGHVVDLKDQIYFEGDSVDALTESMRRAVDHYLQVCAQRREEPDRPFSGRFNVRVKTSMHRRIAAAAAGAGVSMNEWIVATLEGGLEPRRTGRTRRSGTG